MRIALLFLITAAVLGGLVGTLMLRDPGYVLVSYAGRALETSLWFALVLLFIAYFVIRIIVFLTARLLHGRSLLGAWRAERGQRSADKQTVRGLLLLAEGQWD
ncbi:MAG: heme biosynthesis protein HemY, partial [Chloroflexi bacterium]|nr:heme biosynthesis protein HemY [Chloroflexota bacterium]